MRTFIQQEFYEKEKIFAKYNSETKVPNTNNESPAAYSVLLLYCLQVNEKELMGKLYKQMLSFRVMKAKNPYYGGYLVSRQNTSIVENLLPLLAERNISSAN